ncbi:MAG: hypothetical protein H0T15_06300 [Thermoleophilaceae bacterium]|nr:hypothetical protein [Thermoleophilaceae bacterium]
MATPDTTLDRAEALAESILPEHTPKKRMLVIVNPYATTVSARLKNLVVYALEGRYDVEAVDTEAQGHATELCREAAHEGYDVVVAFGGDGTVNEAANGLVGSRTPLSCLPGGATNVYCRTLGIPGDVVDATEHMLRMADTFEPRDVDLGRIDERWFTFAAGTGLDASVVERVDSRPTLKSRGGEWYYTWSAISTFNRRYLLNPPRVRVEADGRVSEGVTVVIQNSDPYTYFGRRPIRLATNAGLETGSLDLTVLRRAAPLDVPTFMARVFTADPARVQRHRHLEEFQGVPRATISAVEGTFPAQVDGDFIGRFEQVELSIKPRGLRVVS